MGATCFFCVFCWRSAPPSICDAERGAVCYARSSCRLGEGEANSPTRNLTSQFNAANTNGEVSVQGCCVIPSGGEATEMSVGLSAVGQSKTCLILAICREPIPREGFGHLVPYYEPTVNPNEPR